MPSNAMLVQALKEKTDWQLASKDEASSLFVRKAKKLEPEDEVIR